MINIHPAIPSIIYKNINSRPGFLSSGVSSSSPARVVRVKISGDISICLLWIIGIREYSREEIEYREWGKGED